MKIIYVSKIDPTLNQEYPVPTYPGDFYEVSVPDNFTPIGKVYDPASHTFVTKTNAVDVGVYKDNIDKIIDSFRLRFCTNITGQPLVYAAKVEDAKEYQKSGTIGQFLKAEMNSSASTADSAATRILVESDKFYKLAAITEEMRRSAKIQIDTLIPLTEIAAKSVITGLTQKLEGLL